MGLSIKFLSIFVCFNLFIEAIQCQEVFPNHLLPQEAVGELVPPQYIKAPVVTTLKPPIQIKSSLPQIITRTTKQIPTGPVKLENIRVSENTTAGQGSFEYPIVSSLISKPFLAGIPEKVLAKPLLKKNTGPDVVLTYDLSNGLKDLTIGEMYQDKQQNLWATTAYGGVFKFDGKYFHYIAEAQGLASNTVDNILFTSDEEIWFGTLDGVSRYDGKYMTNYTTESGLLSNWIKGIEEDKYGNIWVASLKGLQMIDKNNNIIYTFNLDHERYGVMGKVKKDHKGNLWINLEENTFAIIFLEKKGETYSFKFNYYAHDFGPIRHYHEDHSGNMWIGASNGFYKISILNNDYENLITTDYDQVMQTSSNHITNVDEDNEDRLWISTRENGVYILDPGNDQSSPSYSNLTGPYDIPETFVSGIFCDNKHNIWMASAGLSMIKKSPFHIFNQVETPSCIVEDQQQNMWIGAKRGLYKYNPLSPDTILLYTQKEGLPVLSGSSISDLIVDKNGVIWIATLGDGLVLFKPGDRNQTGFFSHYPREKGIPSEFVTKFVEDKNEEIWFSSYENSIAPTGGLSKIEGDKMTFIGIDQGLIHEDVMAMDYDVFGNFWIGSWGLGINKYEPGTKDGKAKVSHFTSKHISIENRVRAVEADRKGNVWTGGYGAVGITQFLPSKNDKANFVRHYSLAQGLSSTNLMSALEDDEGNLWFGTAYGLNFLSADQVALPTENRPIISFTEVDGFPARACQRNVLYQSSDGLIWVGGDDRLIYFDPKELIKKTATPSMFLLEVSLFNQPIHWKKDSTFVLDNGKVVQDFSFDSLSYFDYLPQGLRLTYNNNFIDFDYAAGSVDDSHNISYQTILEGLEENWGVSTIESKISYNGLRHGEYLFKVRARRENGEWGAPVVFPFKILPPLWKTWWAYTLYILLGFLILYLLYRIQITRKLDKAESLRLIELDEVKTRMYTNITHEFRTPLTVISGMAAQIKENPKVWFNEGLSMIQRNTNRLLNLVNQLLDLSKLESGKIALHAEQGDIITYLKYLVESIHSLAESKQIQLHFHAEEDEVIMDFDPEKIQQVIINLLSNAIKFTPKEGHVYVDIEMVQMPDKKSSLQIKIRDSGPGIPEEQIPFIFDRFYQVDDSSTRQKEGSGIGLALVKELVKLMDGEITGKSKSGKETVFNVILPIRNKTQEFAKSEIKSESFDKTNSETAISFSHKEKNDGLLHSSKPRILLIEDNRDVVTYIAACLQDTYDIKVGKDGQEGIDIAIENIPDLIVTDVMMPFKDGYTVCNTLKNDERTSHIPIIMLTAKADMESKLEGLEKGADAYLAKPFHKKELIIRIKKLLELRQKLQGYYLSLVSSGSTESFKQEIPEIATLENQFVIKLRKVIELHLNDNEFNVEKLCKEIGISHSQLYRKMIALVGLSPNKFIRFIRLNKAKVLLKNPDTNISAIAYETGFSDPSYFGRAFKKEFGMTPVEWKERAKT